MTATQACSLYRPRCVHTSIDRFSKPAPAAPVTLNAESCALVAEAERRVRLWCCTTCSTEGTWTAGWMWIAQGPPCRRCGAFEIERVLCPACAANEMAAERAN